MTLTFVQARQMASGVLPSSAGATSKLFMPRSKQATNQQEPPPVCDPVEAEDLLTDKVDHTVEQTSEGAQEETSGERLEISTTAPCLDFEAADDADLLEACRQFDCAQPESAAAR